MGLERLKQFLKNVLEVKELLALAAPVLVGAVGYFRPDYLGEIIGVDPPTVEISYWFASFFCLAAVITLVRTHRTAKARGRFRFPRLGWLLLTLAVLVALGLRLIAASLSDSPPVGDPAALWEGVRIAGAAAFITTMFAGAFRTILELLPLN